MRRDLAHDGQPRSYRLLRWVRVLLIVAVLLLWAALMLAVFTHGGHALLDFTGARQIFLALFIGVPLLMTVAGLISICTAKERDFDL